MMPTMSKVMVLITAIGIAGGLVGPAMGADAYNLSVAPQPGQYLMTSESKSTTSMEMSGMPGASRTMTQKTSKRQVLTLDVQPAEKPDHTKITLQFREIHQMIDAGPQGRAEYDSTDPTKQANQFKAMFDPILDAEIVLILDSDGRVVETRGVEHIWAGLLETNPQAQTEIQAMQENLSKQLAQRIGTEEVAPVEPVEVGQSWDNDQEVAVPMLGTVQASQTSTLSEVQSGPVAVIDSEGSVDKAGGQKVNVPDSPMAMTLKTLTAKLHGTARVDLDKGISTKRMFDQSANMVLTMDTPPQAQNQGAAPTMTMTTTMESHAVSTIREGTYQLPEVTESQQDQAAPPADESAPGE